MASRMAFALFVVALTQTTMKGFNHSRWLCHAAFVRPTIQRLRPAPSLLFSTTSPSQRTARSKVHSTKGATSQTPLPLGSNSNKKKINNEPDNDSRALNLSTVTQEELQDLVVNLGHPKFRAKQVWQWIRGQGVTDVDQMHNVPKALRAQLAQYCKPTALSIDMELQSKDGTIKRAYRCHDGQVIESVLMPYEDGRYTACISSQAGCAQGCVFCATGQMGFARQLTSDEIFEQVARFANELQQQNKEEKNNKSQTASLAATKQHGRTTRLSNIVFMGMGEPLANLRHVKTAIQRITKELGIGARRITVSTVGIVPNIRKLYQDPDIPPVRLAVSLHCATDEERNALLPANRRYGGLTELMSCLQEYMTATGQRITLEWALIEGQNDGTDTARQLGRLLVQKAQLRRDMVHVNVIPLNPTGGFGGSPSGRQRVDLFCQTLQQEFGISCTPRVRRGIDIDAGCGQLKAKVLKEQEEQQAGQPELHDFVSEAAGSLDRSQQQKSPLIGVYEDKDDDGDSAECMDEAVVVQDFSIHENVEDTDAVDFEDPEYVKGSWESTEAERLIALVKGSTIPMRGVDSSGLKRP